MLTHWAGMFASACIGLACLHVHGHAWSGHAWSGHAWSGPLAWAFTGLAFMDEHPLGWPQRCRAIAIALNCACKREPCRRNNLWAPTDQFCLGELSPSETVNALTRPSIQDSQQYHELKFTARECRHSLRSSRTMQSSAGKNRAGTSVMVFSSE
jgi:hypothetical protein